MLTRRLAIALMMSLFAVLPVHAQNNGSLDKYGLHVQDWFHQGPIDMQNILFDAGAQGKGMIVLFEQRGCHYCAQLHAVNFKKDELTDVMKDNFTIVQINLNGALDVVDFDGTVLSESDLTDRWGVQFTPTTLVFGANKIRMTTRKEAESFRLPGYLKPFYYLSALDFLITGAFENTRFQTFVEDRVAKAKQAGIDPELW